MTPPEAPQKSVAAGDMLPAVSAVQTIKKRADFLRASRGRKAVMPGFILQAFDQGNADVRVGFTCSRKIGNAVARNRAKRRLREIARLVLPQQGKPGFDYVLIGRRDVTANRNFSDLKNDLRAALANVHRDAK